MTTNPEHADPQAPGWTSQKGYIQPEEPEASGGGGVESGHSIFQWSFAIDGGAIGDLQMRGDPIPAGAVWAVPSAVILVDETLETPDPVNNWCMIRIGTASNTGDITTVYFGDTSPMPAGAWTGSNALSTEHLAGTPAGNPVMTIQDAPLSGGAFRLFLPWYVLPDPS